MTLGEGFAAALRAARRGEEWAWEALYRDLAPSVLGYLRAGGAADPEDVTGEVFLQVVKNLDRFRGDERDFRAWVLTIAHRRLVDDRRARRRRPSEPAPPEVLIEAAATVDIEDLGIHGVEAERALRALRTLSPDQRDVVALRLVADLTIEQVATILDKRPGAVKALQRRGLAALKKNLSAQGVPL